MLQKKERTRDRFASASRRSVSLFAWRRSELRSQAVDRGVFFFSCQVYRYQYTGSNICLWSGTIRVWKCMSLVKKSLSVFHMRVTAEERRLPDRHGSSCCVNASFGSLHALFANSNTVFGAQRSECLSNGPFWTETMKEHRKVRAKQPAALARQPTARASLHAHLCS